MLRLRFGCAGLRLEEPLQPCRCDLPLDQVAPTSASAGFAPLWHRESLVPSARRASIAISSKPQRGESRERSIGGDGLPGVGDGSRWRASRGATPPSPRLVAPSQCAGEADHPSLGTEQIAWTAPDGRCVVRIAPNVPYAGARPTGHRRHSSGADRLAIRATPGSPRPVTRDSLPTWITPGSVARSAEVIDHLSGDVQVVRKLARREHAFEAVRRCNPHANEVRQTPPDVLEMTRERTPTTRATDPGHEAKCVLQVSNRPLCDPFRNQTSPCDQVECGAT